MSFARNYRVVGLCVALLFVSVAAGDLVICPKCGYENEEGSARCGHCGSAADGPVTVEAEPAPKEAAEEEASGQVFSLDRAVVEAEFEMGGKCLAEGDPETARFFFRNAAALELLTASDGDPARSQEILERLEQCEQGRWLGRAVCPACNGTGKRTFSGATLKGELVEREAAGKTCPQCGGAGTVDRRMAVSEWKYAFGRSLSRYKTIQLGRKYVPVGEAWVPAALEGKLAAGRAALIKRATAAACPECLGCGRLDCPECNGSGRVPCSNRDCVNGYVQVESDRRLGDGGRTQRRRCPVCSGRASLSCPDCRGQGSILCEECNGTGEREPCRKCSGRGLATCRRCRGAGSYRGGTCAECGGEGAVSCTSCNGDGRKR